MAGETIESTGAEGGAKKSAGLPQMDVATFPSQLFWLAITFGFLFVVLWRIVMPRLNHAIGARSAKISGDLAEAEKAKAEAANALLAYEAALAEARGRAVKMAEENRKQVTASIDALKAQADAQTAKTTSEAEARIAQSRSAATSHVRAIASEVAANIVERLTGEAVSSAEAAKAVEGA
jgi:F-type H+-transporting ATPase subunit b